MRLCFLTVLFASASEATATWRFTNFVLYCILLYGQTWVLLVFLQRTHMAQLAKFILFWTKLYISTSPVILAYLYRPTIVLLWSRSSGFPAYRSQPSVLIHHRPAAAAGRRHRTQPARYCNTHRRSADTIRYDTIPDAILTCVRKPTWVSLIYRTEPTTKRCKNRRKKQKVENRCAQK